MNKNITYPKELKCPACHVVADSDVEYWMQDYDFPSRIIEQCNNPKCEDYCDDFKVNLKVAITVAEGWIPVTDHLPDDGQECWTFQPDRFVPFAIGAHVSAHTFCDRGGHYIPARPGEGFSALQKPFWKPLIDHDESALSLYEDRGDEILIPITHWQPLERPEAPGVDDGS